jgi:transglutaminase-like putative cysteine protease
MPVLSIRHLTRYRYRKPVALGEHRIMFRPREGHDQRLIDCDLAVGPEPLALRHAHDLFGNAVSIAAFEGPTRELTFDSFVRLEHAPPPAFEGLDEDAATLAGGVFSYGADEAPDLAPFIARRTEPDDPVAAWARRFVGPAGLKAVLADMTGAVHADFRYVQRLEQGSQSPARTLALGSGTCRDYAVLMMDAARSLGLAARFVSGYIYSPGGGGRLGGGHTHAWVSVFLPGCGWTEFDPTNGIVGSDDLVRVAVARDPAQATPLHGTYFGMASDFIDMEVEVEVRTESAEVVHLPAPRAVGMAS